MLEEDEDHDLQAAATSTSTNKKRTDRMNGEGFILFVGRLCTVHHTEVVLWSLNTKVRFFVSGAVLPSFQPPQWCDFVVAEKVEVWSF